MSDYLYEGFLGSGTFSSVFLARDIQRNFRKVVVKILRKLEEEKIKDEFEILDFLRKHDCPNVSKFLSVFSYKDIQSEQYILKQFSRNKFQAIDQDSSNWYNAALVFDFVSGTTMKDLFGSISDNDLRCLLYDVLSGLSKMHELGIMHRDIKPINILYDTKMKRAEIIDFGFAKQFNSDEAFDLNVGTKIYKAPELLLNVTCYDYAADIWALGVSIAEFAFNSTQPLFDGFEYRQVLNNIAKQLGTDNLIKVLEKYQLKVDQYTSQKINQRYNKQKWSNYQSQNAINYLNEDLEDLLNKMLVFDYSERISAQDSLSHRYFDPIREFKKGTNKSEIDFGNIQFSNYLQNYINVTQAEYSVEELQEKVINKELKTFDVILDQVTIDLDMEDFHDEKFNYEFQYQQNQGSKYFNYKQKLQQIKEQYFQTKKNKQYD